MNQRNIRINNVLYEVIDMEQFIQSPEGMYDINFIAILFKEQVDIYNNMIPSFVLPFRTQAEYSKGIPGIYGISTNEDLTPIFNVIFPYHYENSTIIFDRQEYLAQNMLDTSNVNNMKELIEMDAKYREFEFDIITASDNSIILKITPNDTAEMAAFKQAINDKHIDLDKYRARFGKTYPNDKRSLINGDSITFTKLKEYADALDMAITLSIDNVSPNVPNPMSHPITVQITGARANDYDNLYSQPVNEDNDQEDDEDDI